MFVGSPVGVCAAALDMMQPDRCQENFILAQPWNLGLGSLVGYIGFGT